MFRSPMLFYYWRKILLNQFSPLFDHVNTIEQIKIVWWHIEIMLHILKLMYVLTSYCDEGDMYDSILLPHVYMLLQKKMVEHLE